MLQQVLGMTSKEQWLAHFSGIFVFVKNAVAYSWKSMMMVGVIWPGSMMGGVLWFSWNLIDAASSAFGCCTDITIELKDESDVKEILWSGLGGRTAGMGSLLGLWKQFSCNGTGSGEAGTLHNLHDWRAASVDTVIQSCMHFIRQRSWIYAHKKQQLIL